MPAFNILHLTDLHWGLSEQESRFPNIRRSFYDDLEKIKHTGPWDIILFSGDLVQSGKREQFELLNKLLEGLWKHFENLGSFPLLLAIPGNHDLDRPDKSNPFVKLLTRLAKDEQADEIWNSLLNDKDSDYSKIIYKVFDAYSKWWENAPHKESKKLSVDVQMGIIPGDFVATIEKEGIRVGIAGLNSTFLQLTGDNFEGKLAVDVRQFHNVAKKAGEEDGESWIDKHHTCLLMTHQPPSWLESKNRNNFFQLIAKPENFILHFCGHLHKAEAETRSRGFSLERRLMQGGSLFGFGDEDKVISAYSACRIEIDQNKPKGTFRIWPRLAIPRQDNTLSFAPDNTFSLEEDNGTREIEFDLNIIPRGNGKTPKEDEPIPFIPPLPKIDLNALYNKQFVGREGFLRDFKNALRTIFSERNSSFFDEEAKLIWVHGFGGMGKSWFLRKACLEAMSLDMEIKVALIDWYVPEWHDPASNPFSDFSKLFDTISFRLAQLYGAENLIDFWVVRKKVIEFSKAYKEYKSSLELTLDLLEIHGPNWKSEFADVIRKMVNNRGNSEDEAFIKLRNLEKILKDQGLWSDDKLNLQKIIQEIQKNLNEYDIVEDNNTNVFKNILPAWIQSCSQLEDNALLRPYLVLAKALQESIRSLCAKVPLMIVLDTCEMLPTTVDEWLRKTFIPLINDQTSILILIGSRHKPDLHINPGLNRGWKVEVNSTKFRSMPFYEEVRFDVTEISRALEAANIQFYSDDLPFLLHQITLGVPLAIGTILQLHNEGDNVLEELEQLKTDAINELNSTRAESLIIEIVARRFLLHLENRQDKIEDYKNVVILALLKYHKMNTLINLWGETAYIPTLRSLGRKYALLSDGDLHPTVQDFLRRYWKAQPNNLVIENAKALIRALRENQPEGFLENEKFVNWKLEELNLTIWVEKENSFNELVKTLVLFLTYGVKVYQLVDLAENCSINKIVNIQAKEIFTKLERNDYYSWSSRLPLETEALLWIKNNFSQNWNKFEDTCLELLLGISLSSEEEYLKAVEIFIMCFSVFKEDLKIDIPRQNFIVQTFLGAIAKIDQKRSDLAEKGLQTLIKYKLFERSTEWNENYYWLLHNSKWYQEAADYCKFILVHHPDSTSAIAFLGHNLVKHLAQFDEAEKVFKEGLSKFPSDPNLHSNLADLLLERGKLGEALDEYKNALKFIYSAADKDQILPDLISVLIDLKEITEARKLFNDISILKQKDNYSDDYSIDSLLDGSYYDNRRKKINSLKASRVIIKFSNSLKDLGQISESKETLKLLDRLKLDEANILNSLAWQQYLLNDLDDAEKNALKSFNLELNNYVLQTLTAILIRKRKWTEAKPKLIEWTRKIKVEELKKGWKDFKLMFEDIIDGGYSHECVEILEQRNDENVWLTLKSALSNQQLPESL